MSEVKAFELAGIKTWIPSGDHWPPHLHARRPGQWTVRVFILEDGPGMINVKGGKILGRDVRALVAAVTEHRADLLIEWEDCKADC